MSAPIAAFSSYSPAAASTRVRLYDWFDHLGLVAERHCYAGLRAAAPAVLVRHLGEVATAEADLRRFSPGGRTVIMSREASPLSRGAQEQRILSGAAHSAFDFDDAIYLSPSFGRRLFDPSGKFARCAAAADVAHRNGVSLVRCAVRGDSLDFVVSVTVRQSVRLGLPLLPEGVSATAHAGRLGVINRG